LTTPLIKKADGTKFGKTEGGNIWLDKNRTSPYKFYQFWLNAADADAANFIRIFSTKGQQEIEQLIAIHALAPHERKLQRALAEEVTIRVHSKEDYEAAVEASEILFGRATSDSLKKLSVFEGVPQAEVKKEQLLGADVIDVLSDLSGFLKSKGEARRAMQENSICINKEKAGEGLTISADDLIKDQYLLLQRGKKNYFVLKAV